MMTKEILSHRRIAEQIMSDRLRLNMAGPSSEWSDVTQTVWLTAIGAIADLLRTNEGTLQIPEDFGKTYSVLQDWTTTISHRQQGTLIMALRGPDGHPKESSCKNIIRSFRACVMNSGDTKQPLGRDEKLLSVYDTYMTMKHISREIDWTAQVENFVRDIDTYNVHFLQHLIHASMVIWINHPNEYIRDAWGHFAQRVARKLHLHLETPEEFIHRLRDGVRTEKEELA